jgi:hypothetical protein
MTRRRARRFAVLVDAFRLLVRRVRMPPIERRPTTWLSEPPRLVLPPGWHADELESTTRGDGAACSPDVPLEPTRGDARSHAVRHDPSHHRETNAERRRPAGDALPERDRWDERDNIITCTSVDAVPWQPRPPGDLATGSTPRDRQASRDATWIAVGLGAPAYLPHDPRLGVAASAGEMPQPGAPTHPHAGILTVSPSTSHTPARPERGAAAEIRRRVWAQATGER